MSSLQKLASHHLLRRIPPPIPPLRRYSLPSNPPISGEQDPLIFNQRNLPTDYNPSTFDPTEHRTPPSDRVWRLVDEVSSLTLAEIVNLSSILMRKADLTDFPVIGIMKMGDSLPGVSDSGLGAESEVMEGEKMEKMVFELKLESFEAGMKIRVIKEVRAMTDLGLKEAKELVEKSPCVIKSGVSKEEAERVLEKMKDAGAKVVMV